MITVEMDLMFKRTDGAYQCIFRTFDVDSDLEARIVEHADEWIEEHNDEDGEWELVEAIVKDYDNDYADPNKFDTLDDYGEYIENCERYGEAYVLRFEDVDDFTNMDEYEGCWDSVEDFAQHIVKECFNIDIPTFVHIDWESTARDLLMDYSVYEGDEGYHIFRDT